MNEDLVRILNVKGKNEPQIIDWKAAEEKCSFSFPQDYKEFIEKYGSGCLNGWLWIFSPSSANENLNVIDQTERIRKSHMIMKMSFPGEIKYPFYDGEKGLFPWGINDDGDGYYWYITENKTKIVSAAKHLMEAYEYDMSFSDFLYSILTGKIDNDYLPTDFLRGKPRYKKVG